MKFLAVLFKYLLRLLSVRIEVRKDGGHIFSISIFAVIVIVALILEIISK